MIICGVCKTENDEFAITCRNCKSYIQNRIPNLDFFDTAWKAIESPRRAFHDITLAEHKNYSLLLFALFGIGLSLTGFWYFKLGSRFESILNLLGEAIAIGVVLGFVSAALFSVLLSLTIRMMGGKWAIRNSLGILAYATTPVSLSLVFILPVELLSFGMYLFTSNPDPFTLKPGIYIALISFDCAMALWAFVLSVVGTSVSKQLSVVKSLVAMVVTAGVSLGILFLVTRHLIRYV
jgi:Yip1 domain